MQNNQPNTGHGACEAQAPIHAGPDAAADAAALLQATLALYGAARAGTLFDGGCAALRAALDCPWLALLRLADDLRFDRVPALAVAAGEAAVPAAALPGLVRRVVGTNGNREALIRGEAILRSDGAAPATPFCLAQVEPAGSDSRYLLVIGCPASSSDEQRVLERTRLLLPHLAEALAIGIELASSRADLQLAAATLDRVCNGYLLLDADGTVRFANAEARRILQSGDGMALRGTRLEVSDAAFRLELGRMFDALDMGHTPDAHTLQAERPSVDAPFIVSMLPVVVAGAPGHDPSRHPLLVTITDPSFPKLPGEDRLVSVFGLTSAEARVCRPVAAGCDLEAVAAALYVSLTTVRCHLRNIYHKLRVNSRVALVRRLHGHCWSADPLVIDTRNIAPAWLTRPPSNPTD